MERETLNERQPNVASRSLLIVSCGGTISSISSGIGATPTLTASSLTASVPELSSFADITTRTFSVLPSSYLTLADVVALHRMVDEWVETLNEPYGGVVVTQGTDTIEETAYAFDLIWSRPIPVVFTGAMRNTSLLSADGPANLFGAARTALSSDAHGLGVLVVLNDAIHAARFVRKTHTSNLATFQSPSLGPIGYLSEGEPRIVFVPRWRESLGALPAEFESPPVALLKLSLGDDGRLVDQVLSSGFRGLVIEGFGGGHLNQLIADSPSFKELLSAIPVVLSTRAGAGEVLRSTYSGFSGFEVELIEQGVIPSGILDGSKARILLSFLLAMGKGVGEIRMQFARHGLYSSQS